MSEEWRVEPEKWKVETQQRGTIVRVAATHSCGRDYVMHVARPDILDRLCGVTFDQKISRAIAKCQRICDERNFKEKEAREALSETQRALDAARKRTNL